LQIVGSLKKIVVEMIAVGYLTLMSWIVALRTVERIAVALISALIVARAVVPAFAAAVVVVEVAFAVVVEAFADRVQIYFCAACGLNGFSLQL